MLHLITQRNCITQSREVKNILIIYDRENKLFIGDTFLLINKLAGCHSFFTHAAIDINCRTIQYADMCNALLKHNPFIRSFNSTPWEELDFLFYDIVFCILRDEMPLLQVFEQQYAHIIPLHWTTAVYSMSVQFFNWGPNPVVNSVFPPFKEILDNNPAYIEPLRELYISPEEKRWGNHWLKSNGVHEHERLYIILDSTSERYKLMNMDTYRTVLLHLLQDESVKVLIFDEQDIGKKSFYTEWLGEDNVSKILFSKKLSLREALCILSSDYTKLIFGPCTGLIHCASGIYNYFVRMGMPVDSVPAIITYTGRYADGHTAAYWWGHSPLVTCLILRAANNKSKEVVALSQLSEEEKKDTSCLLWCCDYTPDMFIPFLPAHVNAVII